MTGRSPLGARASLKVQCALVEGLEFLIWPKAATAQERRADVAAHPERRVLGGAGRGMPQVGVVERDVTSLAVHPDLAGHLLERKGQLRRCPRGGSRGRHEGTRWRATWGRGGW